MSDREDRDRYTPALIEPKWQARWDEEKPFVAVRHPGRPKMYVLDMFPYPSGSGLHVGHPEGYTATDILVRYKRMRGFDVLHPMGWDAFGLPAEQYAIRTGTHPRATTLRNIATFRRQLKSLGFSYDWSREVDTTDPGYVKWTQWIFLQLYKKGLAFQSEVPVNWCPALGTVLANEEVIDGKSEIGGHPIEKLPLRQWMLRITRYADRLDADLSMLRLARHEGEAAPLDRTERRGRRRLRRGRRGRIPSASSRRAWTRSRGPPTSSSRRSIRSSCRSRATRSAPRWRSTLQPRRRRAISTARISRRPRRGSLSARSPSTPRTGIGPRSGRGTTSSGRTGRGP